MSRGSSALPEQHLGLPLVMSLNVAPNRRSNHYEHNLSPSLGQVRRPRLLLRARIHMKQTHTSTKSSISSCHSSAIAWDFSQPSGNNSNPLDTCFPELPYFFNVTMPGIAGITLFLIHTISSPNLTLLNSWIYCIFRLNLSVTIALLLLTSSWANIASKLLGGKGRAGEYWR